MPLNSAFKKISFLGLFFSSLNAMAYDLTGVNTAFNFGTIAPPFPALTQTDASICVGYTAGIEPRRYRVQARSSSSISTIFQMANAADNTYKLNYSVSWADSSGGSPAFVTLSSGINSSGTFSAQLLGGLTCLALPSNATLRLQLLSADQILSKQGSYTDTLTILIVAG